MGKYTFDATRGIPEVEELLREAYGEEGVQFINPQLKIVRKCRKLPRLMEDSRLETVKFQHSLNLINDWLAPISEVTESYLIEAESSLSKLQAKAKFLVKQKGFRSWKQVIESPDAEVLRLVKDITELRGLILKYRDELLETSGRDEITHLFALTNFPFSTKSTLGETLKEVKRFFGPNIKYRKKDIYTDALLLMSVVDRARESKQTEKIQLKEIERLVEGQLSNLNEQIEWTKYQKDPSEGWLTEKTVILLVKKLLGVRLSADLRQEVSKYYDSNNDRYPIRKVLEWLVIKGQEFDQAKEDNAKLFGSKVSQEIRTKSHLLGLSFMDKHRYSSVVGNVPQSSFKLFEEVLSPFHELKQDGFFMSSAQFEIDCRGLPEQAWIYDYTAVKSEILRSTLLLISDRLPKFDMLESAMRLACGVLSGRVDRNDFPVEGNYTVTGKLPNRSWNYVENSLVNILEEALVHEEGQSQRIIKNTFAEEDRSKLITSKKFLPAFQIDLEFEHDKKSDQKKPSEVTIHAAENFDLQFRHLAAAGYPWYFQSNNYLERLVRDALDVPSHLLVQLADSVRLREVVYSVDGMAYILYYQPREKGISALAFREVDLTVDGIHSVEVIFRPQKFLDRGPKKNNLITRLEKARASDPKDLYAVVSAL